MQNILTSVCARESDWTVQGFSLFRAVPNGFDCYLLDADPRDDTQRQAVASFLRSAAVPVVALIPQLDPTTERDVRRFGARVVRRRPDLAGLSTPGGYQELLALIRAAVRTAPGGSVGTEAVATGSGGQVGEVLGASAAPTARSWAKVLVIGASTGGPQAVRSVLTGLGTAPPVPVVVVQHISAQFAPGFARWLASVVPQPIEMVHESMPLTTGVVHIPMPARHIVILPGGRIGFDDGPRRNFQKPSVDVLFESAAASFGGAVCAVLLTGMGRDGAEGCVAVRDAGGYTIVQDESSSVVFGMPRMAIEAGGACEIKPLDAIGSRAGTLLRTSTAP